MTTSAIYRGNGVRTDFNITFPYGTASDIQVFVNEIQTGFSLASLSAVRIQPAPANGASVKVARRTSFDVPVTQFRDGSVLTEVDLNSAVIQLFNRTQELSDGQDGLAIRAVKVPESEVGLTLPPAAQRINKVLAFNFEGAPEVSSGIQFKGDPGGNVMAIGLFAYASTLNIPVGTDMVQTSGYGMIGRGSAEYFFDPEVNAAFVAANPRTSFISNNGRGFRLRPEQRRFTASQFGAIGDGVADDTNAIQAVFDFFADRGGAWEFPIGYFRTTREIVIRSSKAQQITGNGMRPIYPGAYTVNPNEQISVVIGDHSERNVFRFVGDTTGNGSIRFRNLSVVTKRTDVEGGANYPKSAFGWNAKPTFLRDFHFDHMSIQGFVSAFDTYLDSATSGTNTEIGTIIIENSNISRNEWISRTLDGTQWNGFTFRSNEAGQNGYLPGQGGLSVQAHNSVVQGNVLEGVRDPIELKGGMRGITVADNYLEANVGDFLVHINGARGEVFVGPQTKLAINPTNLKIPGVLLSNTGTHVKVVGTYWPNGVYKMSPQVFGASDAGSDNILPPNMDTSVYGYMRVDSLDLIHPLREPENLSISKQRVTPNGRELAPWNGRPMPVEEHTTSGIGAIPFLYNISGASGTWAVVSWLFKRTPDSNGAADPYITISVNNQGTNGSRDYVLNAFNENWRDGEWALVTMAIRLTGSMTSLAVRAYPYGINPTSGRKTRYLRPVVYVTDSPSKIVPYIDDYTARSVTTTPNSVAEFQPGDILFNGAVASGQGGEFLKLPGGADQWVYT